MKYYTVMKHKTDRPCERLVAEHEGKLCYLQKVEPDLKREDGTAMSQPITIIECNAEGETFMMHTDKFDARTLGRVTEAVRVSDVEFNPKTQQWEAKPTHAGRLMLNCVSHRSRGECIASEVRQILSHALRFGYKLQSNK
jgi:hypothetical protein